MRSRGRAATRQRLKASQTPSGGLGREETPRIFNEESSTTCLVAIVVGIMVITFIVVTSRSPTAEAFDSYPVGAQHDQITERAAKAVGLSKEKTAQLKKAVRAPDWDESSWDPGVWPWQWVAFSPNANYDASHHCDRGPGVSHAAAFVATARYINQKKQEAVDAAKANRQGDALKALGEALHALQDCKSHSNYVDLTIAERAAFEATLENPAANPPPANLKITGYDPSASNPEAPPGDAYSHKDFAKDNPTKNAESQIKVACPVPGCGVTDTKFGLAFQAALDESTAFLNSIRASIPVGDWTNLITLTVDPDPSDSRYAWRCSGEDVVSCNGTTVNVSPGSLAAGQQLEVLGVPLRFYYDPSMATGGNGAKMLVHREVRPEDAILSTAAVLQIQYLPLPAFVQDFSTLWVYRWNPSSGEWEALDDVDIDIARGSARFTSLSLGSFAVGSGASPDSVGGEIGLLGAPDVASISAESARGGSGATPIAAAAAAGILALLAGSGWLVRRRCRRV